ncbi:MAG TPA: hypothetical protein PLU35_09455 [Phycisphaerales bacterium]|nr:hypothetical protein [Phycisphaerales bacterium]
MTTALPAAPGYQSIAAFSGMVEGSPEYAEQRWSGPVSSRPAGHQPFSRTLRLDVPGSTETATRTAVARLNEILGLRSNWDSYGAKPIDSTAAVAALMWLYGIDRPGLPAPSVVPVPDGSVQLEWHMHGIDLEVCFQPTGESACSVEDRIKHTEQEGSLEEIGDAVRLVVHELALRTRR